MQLYNPILEATIIRAICTSDSIDAGKILANITEDSFYDESSKGAYQFVKQQALNDGQLPTWQDITTNPDLSESVRNFLTGTETRKVTKKAQLDKLIESASKYEKLRKLFFNADSIINTISGETADIDELVQGMVETVAELQTNVSGVRDQIKYIGYKNNTMDLVNQCLNPTEDLIIPTGFREFDERNGGLPIGDLVMGCGPTGGGKTAIMAIQLLLNMSVSEPTCLVPLEMTEQQTMHRILSNKSKVAINKFTSGKLTEEEKKKATNAYLKFAKEQKKRGSHYAIWDPGKDVSMEEILYSLLPFGFKVILIDYVGLLKGMDDENQWRKLGAAARMAKIFAKNHGITVILLAQLGEDMKVRYSKAMSEHAAVAWHWQYTDKERESGIVTIVPFKSRNQDPTPFDLAADFSTMSVTNVSEADYKSKDDPQGKKTAERVSNTRKSLQKLSKDIEDYNLDDDDD